MSVENRTQAEKASSRGYTLVDVLDPENLARAWKRVKANDGAAGTDGMEVGDFPSFMRQHWEELRGKLEDGSYWPAPVRRVDIHKDGGGQASPRHTDGARPLHPAGDRAGANTSV